MMPDIQMRRRPRSTPVFGRHHGSAAGPWVRFCHVQHMLHVIDIDRREPLVCLDRREDRRCVDR
jgi:hypothetical protein